MKGTVKQVNWAKDIRDTLIINFERDMEFMANGGRWLKIVGSDKKVFRHEKPDSQMLNKYKVKEDNYMFLVEIKDDLIKFMNSIDDAKVFINNRYCDSVIDFFFHNGQLFFDWWNNNNSHGVVWADEKDFSKWWLNGGNFE